jgi:hypothetical protein
VSDQCVQVGDLAELRQHFRDLGIGLAARHSD